MSESFLTFSSAVVRDVLDEDFVTGRRRTCDTTGSTTRARNINDGLNQNRGQETARKKRVVYGVTKKSIPDVPMAGSDRQHRKKRVVYRITKDPIPDVPAVSSDRQRKYVDSKSLVGDDYLANDRMDPWPVVSCQAVSDSHNAIDKDVVDYDCVDHRLPGVDGAALSEKTTNADVFTNNRQSTDYDRMGKTEAGVDRNVEDDEKNDGIHGDERSIVYSDDDDDDDKGCTCEKAFRPVNSK